MKLFKTISICALSLLVVTSCSDSENSVVNKVDIVRYTELEKSLTADYSALVTGLRSKSSNFNDESSVGAIASQHFGKSTDRYNAFINTYENVKSNYNSRIASDVTLSATEKEKVEEILASINSFGNSVDFKLYLENQFDQIAKSNIDVADKDFLLTYVISYKVTLDFLENNLDLIKVEQINGRVEQKDNWWSSWGKCAAGIIGGAGSVGLGGFLGGAAVGTVTLPIVGTVSGAVVGGVGGAIFGGLAGAASAC